MTTLLLLWVFVLAAEKTYLKCKHQAVNVAVTVDIQ